MSCCTSKHGPGFFAVLILTSTKIVAALIFVKIAQSLAIIHYVDKEIKNPNLRGFIKIVVAILGSAKGFRGILTLWG